MRAQRGSDHTILPPRSSVVRIRPGRCIIRRLPLLLDLFAK